MVGHVVIPKAGEAGVLRDMRMRKRILSIILRPFRTKLQFAVSSRKLAALDTVGHIDLICRRGRRYVFDFGDGAG